MRTLRFLIFVTLLAFVMLPLSASTILVDYSAGPFTSVTGATNISFTGLNSTTASGFNQGLATYTWDTLNSPFVSGSASGQYAAPPGLADSEVYMSVGSGGTRPTPVTISFLADITYFGMYMGSPDLYNSIAFYSSADSTTPIATFTGGDFFDPADGSWARGKYINFRSQDGGISKIVMTSNTAAFETANHSYATPEPGTLLTCVFGALLVIGSRKKLLPFTSPAAK